LLRTVFFMPNLIGGLILGFIWQFIFINVFDDIGKMVGTEALSGWLSTTTTGFWGLVILTCWQMAGYIMIIYIAYLESIPAILLKHHKLTVQIVFKDSKTLHFHSLHRHLQLACF